MLCFVYRLRCKGARQGVELITAEPPTRGWLTYNRPHPLGMPGTHALLLEAAARKAEVLPKLEHAKVGRIEGGLLIAGMEFAVDVPLQQRMQTWAIATTKVDAAALVRSLRKKQDVVAAVWVARQA